MTYGLIVTYKQLELLDSNNVEYTFWDIEKLLNETNEKIEIEFEKDDEFNRAKTLLGI